ncbi:MAG: ATP-binding protein [Bacteroidales bacterium]|nr:ATP-binding protein [Bacteroidales bacterium]
METRKYPVDTQTFSKLIEGNYLYVDKTDLIYKMTHDFNYVFLSRPRRFGKSLLCSTLKEYFNGNKDLFKGLKIDALETDWTQYPTINLSFASAKDVSESSLNEIIDSMLSFHERLFGMGNKGNDCGVRLKELIINLAQKTGKNVVVIIDEYDAAMLDTVDNDELQNKIRAIQNKFFSPLKELDQYIRFVFITGITKFSQMSIFSALNNLKDISLWSEYETLCGISHEELITTLKAGLQDFADKNGYTFEQTVEKFRNKYDGYNFSPAKRGVFNPFAVVNALCDKMLNNYWFKSATPTALIKLIRKFNIQMFDFESVDCDSERFDQPVEQVVDLVPFLFQSGYLTIKDYDPEYNTYVLGYPNEEVKSSMARVFNQYTYNINDAVPLKKAYIDFSKDDDLDKFIKALKMFFYRFPCSLNDKKESEKYYHSILYTLLSSFGADIAANLETALGKADLVLKMPKTIYVIELKYNRSVASAKRQIDDRTYAKAYLDSGKRIVKLALKFSSKERNIAGYEAVEEPTENQLKTN